MPVALPAHVPIVCTFRGSALENLHHGSWAAVTTEGQVLAAQGDIDFPIFTRSALKPLQALPLVAHPRFESLGLSQTEIALLCASHNGEARHEEAARSMLGRVGLDETALQCGIHTPYWYSHNDDVRVPEGRSWSSLQHNCSGKHAGMLLLAHLLGSDTARYLEPTHPVQQAIAEAVAYACTLPSPKKMPWGIDGCSAPNYALPLRALARGMAWLACPEPDARFGRAPARLFEAMARHPEMVSGEGRHDLDFTLAGKGDWVSKVGAEAVQIVASRRRRAAVAVKIADGNPRALTVAVCAILERLGWLDTDARATLARWAEVPLRSIRGNEVGRYQALVDQA